LREIIQAKAAHTQESGVMDLEDGSRDYIREEEEHNRVTESSLVAELRPWGTVKFANAEYQDLTRSPS